MKTARVRILQMLFVMVSILEGGLVTAQDTVAGPADGAHSPGCTSMGGSAFSNYFPDSYYKVKLSRLEYSFAAIYGNCPELEKDASTVRYLIRFNTVLDAGLKIRNERCETVQPSNQRAKEIVQATLVKMMSDQFTKKNFGGTTDSLDLDDLVNQALLYSRNFGCDKNQKQHLEPFSIEQLTEKLNHSQPQAN
jgi:hypothetical protein